MGDAKRKLDVGSAIQKVITDKNKGKRQTRLRQNTSSFVQNVADTGAPKRQHAEARRSAAVPVPTDLPVGQQLRLVYDCLRKHRVQKTFQQLKQELGSKVDLGYGSKLLDALEKHDKLDVDLTGQRVKYKPKYSIQNREQLLALVRQHPLGVQTPDIRDAYAGAADDVKALEEDGDIFECGSKLFTAEDHTVVYPNDMRINMDLHESSISTLRKIVLPYKGEESIDAALAEAGIKKALRSTQRLSTAIIEDNANVGKKRKRRAIRNATNKHLPELLQGDLAMQID